jgi:hypothetical protein
MISSWYTIRSSRDEQFGAGSRFQLTVVASPKSIDDSDMVTEPVVLLVQAGMVPIIVAQPLQPRSH